MLPAGIGVGERFAVQTLLGGNVLSAKLPVEKLLGGILDGKLPVEKLPSGKRSLNVFAVDLNRGVLAIEGFGYPTIGHRP